MLESECVSRCVSERTARCLSGLAPQLSSKSIDLLGWSDAEEVFIETRVCRTEFGNFTPLILNNVSEKSLDVFVNKRTRLLHTSKLLVILMFSVFQEDTVVAKMKPFCENISRMSFCFTNILVILVSHIVDIYWLVNSVLFYRGTEAFRCTRETAKR